MASSPLNTDVVTEILSRLPVQSLVRFRAASKFWRDVIDCPSFRKSQIANYKDNDEDYASSILLFKYFLGPKPSKLSWESSIIFRDAGKSLNLPNLGKFVNGLSTTAAYQVRVVGPVAGLICIHSVAPNRDIAVCNPFLDETKILPLHSICSHAYKTDVGISYDDVADDYKVVKLASCKVHGLHASIYSKNMNSWRELAGSGEYTIIDEPIQSSCSNGAVAHWRAIQVGIENKYLILSFDMKTEMFRSFEMNPGYGRYVKVYEKGGTFVLITFDSTWLYIHEGRFERDNNRLVWHHLKTVGVMGGFCDLSLRSGRVVFHEKESVFKRSCKKLILYDYCGEKIVGRVEPPIDCHGLKVFEYNGSFVSP